LHYIRIENIRFRTTLLLLYTKRRSTKVNMNKKSERER